MPLLQADLVALWSAKHFKRPLSMVDFSLLGVSQKSILRLASVGLIDTTNKLDALKLTPAGEEAISSVAQSIYSSSSATAPALGVAVNHALDLLNQHLSKVLEDGNEARRMAWNQVTLETLIWFDAAIRRNISLASEGYKAIGEQLVKLGLLRVTEDGYNYAITPNAHEFLSHFRTSTLYSTRPIASGWHPVLVRYAENAGLLTDGEAR